MPALALPLLGAQDLEHLLGFLPSLEKRLKSQSTALLLITPKIGPFIRRYACEKGVFLAQNRVVSSLVYLNFDIAQVTNDFS